MEVWRDRVSWEERNGQAQAFYTAARENGVCKLCGEGGLYLKGGLHPSGQRGQPVKLCRGNLDAVMRWVEAAGFVCQRCALTPAAGGAIRTKRPSPRTERAAIRQKLKPLRDAKQTPDTCEEYVWSAMKNLRAGGATREEAVAFLGAHTTWMEPEEFRRLLAREKELSC